MSSLQATHLLRRVKSCLFHCLAHRLSGRFSESPQLEGRRFP